MPRPGLSRQPERSGIFRRFCQSSLQPGGAPFLAEFVIESLALRSSEGVIELKSIMSRWTRCSL
jgi:hypothetical protein